MKKIISRSLIFILFGFFFFLMVRLTLPYLAMQDNVAFLRIKQWVIDNQIWKTAFYIHVFSSCFILAAGFTQFSNYILNNYKNIHRVMGWIYVGGILLLSGPAGFVMGIYANGGILSQIAFISLSILWMYFTYKSFAEIRNGNIKDHRRYMIRSFSLTLSAITLRAWKLLLVLMFRPNPMDVYMLVAWLGWIPNLLIAELYLRKFFTKSGLAGIRKAFYL